MNPAAHGGHTETEVCRCGYVRFVNVRENAEGEVEREEGLWTGDSPNLAAQHFRQSAARALRRAAEKLEAAGDMPEIKEVLRYCVTPALAEFKAYMRASKRPRPAKQAPSFQPLPP